MVEIVMKTQIQIKSIYGDVIFECEKENNTMKDTVEEAVKQRVSLCRANLHGVDLRNAKLGYASLIKANLSGADLRRANLYGAHLSEAKLSEANLSGADLRRANFYGADLYRANLNGADLSWSDLRSADLRRAENVPYVPLNCPSEGSFIAWKKVEGKLVKLEIPEDAKRSSATTMKCRCDKAKVLAITDLDGSNPIDAIVNTSIFNFQQLHILLYKVGEMVYPDSFDKDRWNECSHGIHFFVNKQDAINY